MSKIIREIEDRGLCHIIESNGQMYYVDSCFTFDHGLETMVFPWDEENEEVESWSEVYGEWHDSYDEMRKRHRFIIENFEEVSDEEES